MKKLVFLFFMLSFGCHAHSQNWGQVIGEMGEAILLNKVVENRNLQSRDMQLYLDNLRAGHACYNNGSYEDAVSYYKNSSYIISKTNDQNLLKLYHKYGWKKVLDDSYNNAYTKYLATKKQTTTSSQSSIFGSSSSGGTAGSVQAQNCGVCHATGKCSSCNGTGVSPYTGRTCGACGGKKICSTCKGTGVSGHTTTYSTDGTVRATPVQKAQNCGVCHATGKCSTCNGTGVSPYSNSICGACGGSGRCTTCNGTGVSGYITEYIYH